MASTRESSVRGTDADRFVALLTRRSADGGLSRATGIHAGAFSAIGAFGQYIYVHPTAQVVAVIQSAWRQHEDIDATVETFALLRAAVLALRPD